MIQLDIPVFAGQGTTASHSDRTRQQALRDASSPAGSLLLSSCFQAFQNEISTLSPVELSRAGINLADFDGKNTLLDIPSDRYLNNPIITGTTLFLLQSLRYIAFIQAAGDSLTPFSDVLKRNLEHGVGILGFSSGILPACVVATSLSTIAYLSRAVEAYRLAIWIGIRTQLYRVAAHTNDSTLPWSLVFLGIDRQSAEEAVSHFTQGAPSSLFVTAVMDSDCVTISGHPDTLAAFSRTVPTGTVIHKTTLDTLYHSPIHVTGAREEVLADIVRRDIRFPDFSDIKVPIRSTHNGEILDGRVNSGSLVETVVDMVLTQCVRWDLVLSKLVKSIPVDTHVRLLNVGPGTGLTRSAEKAFSRDYISSRDLVDLVSSVDNEAKPKQEPIAIVGMAVNLPGARSASQLWELLENGINTISEIPEHRFKVSDYTNPKDVNSKRQMAAHTGNFIDGADEFDNKFFKVSPREAKSMDPQQRVLLHTAYEALENSGYVPYATPTFQPETFGCYIGVATHDYLQNLRDDIDVYYSTGTLKAFLSGRISYAMQFSGPSIVVDTACSGSSVALYQACRALMNGDCTAALVGGVNIMSSPDMTLGLDRAHFLSPTGQCKAFDVSADGYSRSEGCGVFVMKRLSDALAESDHILGIIRGVEVNQSGNAHSITHPHAPTQASLFKQVLSSSGIDASRVSVVEAHGTGTQAGDPNELESIRSILSISRASNNPLHITSIKANIGHLEAASGAAGLAKLLLMFRHHQIPRVISLKTLNPKIAPLESDNSVIDTKQVPWPSPDGKPRVALLNNFGAAGSNAAILVEEFEPSADIVPLPNNMPFVFGLSAKTEATLEELRLRYLAWLESSDCTARLVDIAYTMTARRQIYAHRLAMQASDKAELIDKLRKAAVVQSSDVSAQVVFVFSGQGGQYLGMGKDLYETSPLFRKDIDECHWNLTASGFPGILPIIRAGPEGSGLSTLDEFEAYQTAIFSIEYALARVWMSWGLIPAAVVGHSLGEYAALVTAGVLPLKSALMIVANRVRFMMQKCAVGITGMIAVNLGPSTVNETLRCSDGFSALSIACYNSATDCVVSGPLGQLQAYKVYLDSEVHCKNVLLSVPFGYHSPAMAPLLDDLALVARSVTIKPPTILVVSNVLGDVVMPGDGSVFRPEYFVRHCAEPVQFAKGIHALVAQPAFAKVEAWIEIGPHTTSIPMLKANAKLSKDTLLLGSLRKQQDAWSTLVNSLSQLYLSNVDLLWREVFSHVPVELCVDLPSYPLARTKFWVPFKENRPLGIQTVAGVVPNPINLISEYKMLHAWAQYPSPVNGHVAIFETPISHLASSIVGHTVGGVPLCPASVYLEQVLAGIELAKRHMGRNFDGSHPVLRKLEFAKPLVYDESVTRTVITSISMDNGSGAFSVSSRVGPSEESVHVHGEYRFQTVLETTSKFSRVFPSVARQMAAVKREASQIFSTRTAYQVIFPRVVSYSKEYHTMQNITVDASGMEGCALVKLPSDHDKGKYVAHPVFVDTLLHVAGFVANMQGAANDAFICSEVGTVKVIPELIDNATSYTVYCNNAWLESEGVMLTEAYAVQIAEPKRIVAHLKGMAFRRVRLDSLKKGLALAAGKSLVPHATGLKPVFSAPTQAVAHVLTRKPVTQKQISPTSRDIRADVLKVISETCDINATSIDVETDLASLGVDSLMSIEIFGTLQDMFTDAHLDAHALSSCSSVADIIREVSAKSTTGPASYKTHSPASTLVAPHITKDSGNNVREEVLKVVSEACNISTESLDIHVDLASLGVDSLMSIEIFARLGDVFPRENLDAQTLSICRSVADIAKYISSLSQPSSGISSPRPLILDEPAPPDAKGTPDVKRLLASILDIGIADISDDTDLESLGLDSLTSIEVVGTLKAELGLDLPGHLFSMYSTPRTVQSYLFQQLRAGVA